jgi:hypothetical protein
MFTNDQDAALHCIAWHSRCSKAGRQGDADFAHGGMASLETKEDGREKWALRIPWHCLLSQNGTLSEGIARMDQQSRAHEPLNSHSRTLPWYR